MYLSKVVLPPYKLNNAYEWHRSLWSLFPNIPQGNTAPFLYYVEQINLANGANMLMQSTVMPEDRSNSATILAKKQFDIFFHTGQYLRYLVQANPTKCIVDKTNKPNKRNGGKCRVPIIDEVEQQNWLIKKLAAVAQIHSINSRTNPPFYFRKGNRAGKIVSVTFSGILEVLDHDAMKMLRENGIGPAKAFGCGLLMVKRI